MEGILDKVRRNQRQRNLPALHWCFEIKPSVIIGSSRISTNLSQWILSFQSLALSWHSRLQQWVLMPGCAGDNSLPDRWITELWSRRLIRPIMTLWWMDFLSTELEPWAVLELSWIGSRTLGFQLLSRGEHSEDPSGSSVLCQKWKEIRYFFPIWPPHLED